MINQLKHYQAAPGTNVGIEGDSLGTRNNFAVGDAAFMAQRIEEENGVVRVYMNSGQIIIFSGGGWGFGDQASEMKAVKEEKAAKAEKRKANGPRKEQEAGLLSGAK